MKITKLSPTEEIILQAIFDLQDASGDVPVPDLTEHLGEKCGKDYARTTVVTFIERMAAKGAVTKYRKGRISYVIPLYSKEAYRDFLINELISGWYGGSREELVRDITK